MDRISNPWVKGTRVKGEGCLNQIMDRIMENLDISLQSVGTISHKFELMQNDQPTQYEQLQKKIQKCYQPQNQIGEYKEFFNLKEKCQKLDQILNWIEKAEQNMNREPQNTTERRHVQDSSFVYLPIHSGAIFQNILKECTIKEKQKNIGEYKNTKLKQSIAQLEGMKGLHEQLQREIM